MFSTYVIERNAKNVLMNATTDVRYAANFKLEERKDDNGESFMYAIEKDPANISGSIIGGK